MDTCSLTVYIQTEDFYAKDAETKFLILTPRGINKTRN